VTLFIAGTDSPIEGPVPADPEHDAAKQTDSATADAASLRGMQHSVGSDDPVSRSSPAPGPSTPRRLWHWFAHLLDDRDPSRLTTNVIRGPDGEATIISSPDGSKGG
jgi:hypothetical protein